MGQRELRAATFTAVGYGTIRTSRKQGPQGILDNTERRYGEQTALSRQYIVSVTVTGDTMCKATDKTYRLDRRWVHEFLDENDLLP